MTGTNSTDLAEMISSLGTDFSALKSLIKTAGSPIVCGNGNVSVRAHYLPFKNGKPQVGELLDAIRAYICNFAISREEINEVHASVANSTPQQKLEAYVRLRDAAADLFIKAQKSTKRNGECGELILYLLTEWVLEAPQVLAKMSLKTSSQMPIHGSDGIHVRFDKAKNRLKFYWGEAKFHASISSAIGSAVDSIASAIEYAKLKEDINLVKRFAHLSGLSVQAQKELVEYLDPLNTKYQNRVDASCCLIGFDFDGFGKAQKLKSEEIEDGFTKLLVSEIGVAASDLLKELGKKGVTHHEMEVFFLPFESVEKLRTDFQNLIGWKT